LPGLAESCLDTLKATMVANLASLNTQIASRAVPISLLPTVVAGQIYIGDPETMPPATTNPFWLSVVGGGKADGKDTEIEIKQSGPGYWPTVYHNIYFYLHHDTFPAAGTLATDAFIQAEARERLRALVQDWLTWACFNNGTNYSITLGSRQFATAPAYDHLDEARISDVTKGFVFKSYGGTQGVLMAHFLHRGRVYGGF
jgi:hypothetical protein